MKLPAALFTTVAASLAGYALGQAHGESYAQTMGPVAFLWPPDREWSETQENIAPCGSSSGVVNRTDFPLTKGNILLVAQDAAWAVDINIAFRSNPTSMNDFSDWYKANVTQQLDGAHSCYPAPDIPSSVKAGDFATIQLVYNALDGSSNISHFACADVKFVDFQDFNPSGYSAFCFSSHSNQKAPDGTPSQLSYSSGQPATTLSTSTTAAPAGATSASATKASASANDALAAGVGYSGLLALAAGGIAALI